jgi:PAS domain S-box-containing protein
MLRPPYRATRRSVASGAANKKKTARPGAFLRDAVNALDDPLFVKDEQHRWVFLNVVQARLLGRPQSELIGKTDFDITPRKQSEVFWRMDDCVLKTGKTSVNEETVTWSGEKHVISTKKSLLLQKRTGRRYVIGTIRDITTQKKLEQERERLHAEVKKQASFLARANWTLRRLREKEKKHLSMLRNEMEIGRRIQADFLPRSLPLIEGWEIAVHFEPAFDVAGDFYDIFALPDNHIAVAIADVCGKGVGAAIFMALVRSLVRAAAKAHPVDPEAVISFVNDYLMENHPHARSMMFATVFYGCIDPLSGEILYVNAGHPAPVVLSPQGTKILAEKKHPALGIRRIDRYEQCSVTIAAGEALFAYTDGVTDTRNSQGVLFDRKRLFDLLGRGGMGAEELVSSVKKALSDLRGDKESRDDDVAMIALKRR